MGGYIGATAVGLTTTAADVQGDITSTDTTPELILKNTSEEDTEGGREGKITFKGEQSGGEESTLAQIESAHDGTSDDQKGDLIFKTNDGSDGASPTERMRIDSSGNVGVGTSSPSNKLDVKGIVGFEATNSTNKWLAYTYTDNTLRFNYNGAGNDEVVIDSSGNVGIGTTSPSQMLTLSNGTFAINGTSSFTSNVEIGRVGGANNMGFATGDTERMRIDSDGRVMFSEMAYSSYPTNNASIKIGRGSDVNMIVVGYGTSHTCVQFKHNGNNVVGSIVTSATATTYNTSSDYRLKENVANISDGITRVKQLSPKRFNFIVDADKTVDGFLAHEAATVVPEAVTGTKDGLEVWTEKEKNELPDGVSVGDNKLDDDGNTIPLMQGIDQAKLVPLLTAALQEAIAKIETLETKVAALEGE